MTDKSHNRIFGVNEFRISRVPHLADSASVVTYAGRYESPRAALAVPFTLHAENRGWPGNILMRGFVDVDLSQFFYEEHASRRRPSAFPSTKVRFKVGEIILHALNNPSSFWGMPNIYGYLREPDRYVRFTGYRKDDGSIAGISAPLIPAASVYEFTWNGYRDDKLSAAVRPEAEARNQLSGPEPG